MNLLALYSSNVHEMLEARETAARETCPVGRRTQPEVVFADCSVAAETRPAMVLSATVDLTGGLLIYNIYPGYNPRLHSSQELRRIREKKKKLPEMQSMN